MHGFAINVGDDLGGFDAIVPCGLEAVRMTSVSRRLGFPVEVEAFAEALVPIARRCFAG